MKPQEIDEWIEKTSYSFTVKPKKGIFTLDHFFQKIRSKVPSSIDITFSDPYEILEEMSSYAKYEALELCKSNLYIHLKETQHEYLLDNFASQCLKRFDFWQTAEKSIQIINQGLPTIGQNVRIFLKEYQTLMRDNQSIPQYYMASIKRTSQYSIEYALGELKAEKIWKAGDYILGRFYMLEIQ